MATINIFISYARADLTYVEELRTHLAALQRTQNIRVWYDGLVNPGEDWDEEIQYELEKADIIILVISANFISSQYIWEVELKKSLERHLARNAIVLPIIARPCAWDKTPIGNIQVLPRNGRPISDFSSRDEAYVDIIRGIRSVIENKIAERKPIVDEPEITSVVLEYELKDVYTTTGIPSITFVEPENFPFIRIDLNQAGTGIVIEGPTGVGKTSAARNLINPEVPIYLNARLPEHLKQIEEIKSLKGIIIVDDFHRLKPELQAMIADYLKYLADYASRTTKLIIIGIPNTGESLIRLSFDLVNRITIFKLGSVSDDTILKLIEKGEEALNIEFISKSSIVREAYGSLYLAQYFCLYIAGINGVKKTQKQKLKIKNDVYDVINQVVENLKPGYENFLRFFASIGEKRDRTCINLLQELAISENGVLNLALLKKRKPELKNGIDKLLQSSEFTGFFHDYPEGRRHILFDEGMPALIIDNPQLKFYLNNTSFDKLESLTGKLQEKQRNKVFISYNHLDEIWLTRVLTYLKPLEKRGLIDLWVDKRIKAGQNWREEINEALNKTKVAILLLSQDFLASDFIIDNEVPPLLKAVEEDEAKILQLFLKPCLINNFPELNQFQMINKPSEPLAGLNEVQQAEILVKLAEIVDEYMKEE